MLLTISTDGPVQCDILDSIKCSFNIKKSGVPFSRAFDGEETSNVIFMKFVPQCFARLDAANLQVSMCLTLEMPYSAPFCIASSSIDNFSTPFPPMRRW